MLPVPGDFSRTLARELVLEGLAASVHVVSRNAGRTLLRIEAPTAQLYKLRSRLDGLAEA
ncbi:MAG: hypothetical protein GY825_14805 [Phycisphaeraceae bacterium]|nr:hypothetical protein [Phycisphaeraceae bacterium]